MSRAVARTAGGLGRARRDQRARGNRRAQPIARRCARPARGTGPRSRRRARDAGSLLARPRRGFTEALVDLKSRCFEVAVFGDIDLQAHRDWEERVSARGGSTATCRSGTSRGETWRARSCAGVSAPSSCAPTAASSTTASAAGRTTSGSSPTCPVTSMHAARTGNSTPSSSTGRASITLCATRTSKRECVAAADPGGLRYCFARLRCA